MAVGEHDDRPWGSYTVVDEGDGYKVKRIVVRPGQRLSYQRHGRRDEHWFAVSGEAVATVDGQRVTLRAGDSIEVHAGTAHRVANEGAVPFLFVEIQRGDYLGEDDITRLEDDYGRVSQPAP